MSQTVLFIGNGFDLDLNLKTKYSQFIDAKWESIATFPNSGLQKLINETRKNIETWFDLESIISNYISDISKQGYVDKMVVKDDLKFYNQMTDALGDYLLKQMRSPYIRTSGKAKEVLILVSDSKDLCAIFTFNYTNLLQLGGKIGVMVPQDKLISLHGDLSSPILGIRDCDEYNVPREYMSWVKCCNKAYKHHDVSQVLVDSDEVIFFGLSFGAIDYIYFQRFFNEIVNWDGTGEKKHITIFTYDYESQLDIVFQLREMGIKLNELMSNSYLTFIRTSNEELSFDDFEQFKNRLLKKGKNIFDIAKESQ